MLLTYTQQRGGCVRLAYLLAGLTSVRLLSAVCPLVPLHVVLLNESHVTLVTAEWLLSCQTEAAQLQVNYLPVYCKHTMTHRLHQVVR